MNSTDPRKYADRYRARFDALLARSEEEADGAPLDQFPQSDIGRLTGLSGERGRSSLTPASLIRTLCLRA